MSSYTVAVRALCEFAAKTGDLDRRFTPSPSAQDGIAGHGIVAGRRGEDYRSEVPLSGRFDALVVRGRADGYDEAAGRIDEVKTFRGSLDRQPENHRALHWAQAKVYGWLLCETEGLPRIEVALVYFDVDTQAETVLRERCMADELKLHFEALCARFLAWAKQEIAHRESRDAALATLAFPHAGGFRQGQRDLAEAVYNAARSGRCLLAEAPTGIGKTMGTLFPLLKAAPAQKLDKVVVLTAKTSGRSLALEAAAALRPLPLRVLELVAREKACEHRDKACHGESCPLAAGFYDRLPAVRDAARELPAWHRDGVRALAREHAVCPYYLGQELARWADVVVGDFNHWFDANAMLHGLATSQSLRVGLLVDEAHNLVERARGMYSATMDEATISGLRRTAPSSLQGAIARVQRAWRELLADHLAEHQVLGEAPERLVDALQQAATAIIDHQAEQPATVDAALQAFGFEALSFVRLAESFGAHSLFEIVRDGDRPATVQLRNLVPAPFLAPRFAAAHTAVLFSATLQPTDFYRDLLGLPANTAVVDVASPFEAAQLEVRVARRISTRYGHREASTAPLVRLIAGQFDEAPGNYLAFFSSFDYLDRVADAFESRHPEVPTWRQRRGMTEAEQADYLARFMPAGRGIGFAVLGGAFAEGVDLAGDRLVGAFVATLGMPPVSPANEETKRRMDTLFDGAGFDYTYLFPGLQKVVQAAGRVIRTPGDRGVLHLIDDRFGRPEVRALLPKWWSLPSP